MHVAICQAVTDFLNLTATQTAVGQTFTATRHAVPVVTVGKNGLKVTVHPGNRTRVPDGRNGVGFDYEVIVTIATRIADNENATVDPLIELGEAIERELVKEDNRWMGDAYLAAIEQVPATPPFIPQAIEEDSTFFAQIPLTYALRAIDG